jgi:hypothetical protein
MTERIKVSDETSDGDQQGSEDKKMMALMVSRSHKDRRIFSHHMLAL